MLVIGMKELLDQLLNPTTPGAIMARAIVWFAVTIAVIAATEATHRHANPERRMKENLGMFLLFLILSGGLIYLLFGITPKA